MGFDKTVDWHARFSQQARWTEGIRLYLFDRIGLASGQRMLEVGCGTGAVLSGLVTKNCQVYGIDIDRGFLLQAQQNIPSARLAQSDAHHLPYVDSSFDITVCHYVLLWVADPAHVVSEMRRVVRPGGWALALAEPDYGGRVDYPESLVQLGSIQEAALRRQGAETRLGRRLSSLFHSTGLQQIETGVLGGQWRLVPSEADLAQEWEMLETDLAKEFTPGELTRLRGLDTEAWTQGKRVLYVPTFYAVGKKL